MGTPKYFERGPAPGVASWVRRVSFSRGGNEDVGRRLFVLPDAHVDILLSWRPGGGGAQAEILGLKTRPLEVWNAEPQIKMAIHLDAASAAALLRGALPELRDGSCSLTDLWPEAAGLLERVVIAGSDSIRQHLVENMVSRAVRQCDGRDPVVERSVLSMERAAGQVSIRKLADSLGISERGLQRRFKSHLGVGPKLVAQIYRFQAAQTAVADGSSLAEAALGAGYFDQSHLARDRRRYGAHELRQVSASS